MRVAVTITQADQRMRDDLWAEFADVVRDCVSDHAVSVFHPTGSAAGTQRGWVADYLEMDVPGAKYALNKIADWYQHPIDWVALSDAAEVLT